MQPDGNGEDKRQSLIYADKADKAGSHLEETKSAFLTVSNTANETQEQNKVEKNVNSSGRLCLESCKICSSYRLD